MVGRQDSGGQVSEAEDQSTTVDHAVRVRARNAARNLSPTPAFQPSTELVQLAQPAAEGRNA
jgi:hypothetical protein